MTIFWDARLLGEHDGVALDEFEEAQEMCSIEMDDEDDDFIF